MNARPLVFLVILLITISCHHEETKNKTVLSKVTTSAFDEADEYIYRSDGTLQRCDIHVAGQLLVHLDYTYVQGKITLIKEYVRDTLYSTRSFVYDGNNNLMEVHIVPNNDLGEEEVLKVTWANNQILKAEDASANIAASFEYDTRNNATKITLTDTNSGTITNSYERTYDDHVNPLFGLGDPIDYYDIPFAVPIFPNNYTSEIAKGSDDKIYSTTEIKNTYNDEGLLIKSTSTTTYPDADSSEEDVIEYVYKKM
ncbi:MAG TPA: hypothetical protein VL443_19940 [Cyclobacteriaceae bacterium]|nr:hypothetical protein [Cyclobacteriaceae bacterium]